MNRLILCIAAVAAATSLSACNKNPSSSAYNNSGASATPG